MLYGFTRAGYPEIPRYAFRDTLEALLRSPNRQLRGAALRVKALCLRDGRADLWDAEETDPVSLLRQSVGCLASSQDVRELALSRHELANTLERLGRHDEARPFRMLVSESIGRASHADMDPLEISILATRDRDSDIFSPGVPNIGTLLRTTSSASSTSPSSNSRPSVPRCSGPRRAATPWSAPPR